MLSRTSVLSMLVFLACAPAPVVRPAWDGNPDARRGEASDVDTTPAQDTTDTALAKEMHDRLDELSLIGPHVVRGDVERARTLGGELLGRIDDEGPEAWAPHVAALRIEVRTLVGADDLPAAAHATARIAAQCGACHDALDIDPRLEEQPMPDGDLDERSRMRLHAWGMARLREGLVGPSLDRWLQGTATFAALPGCREADASRRELCTRVELLAHRAHVTETTSARVHLYGELLATCAGCHAK
jgi:hypothetical protein